MRNTILLRLIVIIFGAHVSSDVLSQNSDSVKCWSEKDRLKWSDYKGKISSNPDSSYLHAVTWCSYNSKPFRKNDILSYHVALVFKKYKSWKRDTAKNLLAHEQLHFDIAELYARKLRKAIRGVSETISNPTRQDFTFVIQKLYLENAAVQNKYDNETVHGVIAESQVAWEKKICLELKKLKDYASKPEDCK